MVSICIKSSALMILLSSGVLLIHDINCINLYQSSLLGSLTRLIKNDTAVSQSGRLLFIAQRTIGTNQRKISAFFLPNNLDPMVHLNNVLAAGVLYALCSNFVSNSSSKVSMMFVKYGTVPIDALPSLNSTSNPRKSNSLPLYICNPGKYPSINFNVSSTTLVFTYDIILSST